MEHRYLLREVDGWLCVLTMNRPERRNALSLELMREMIEAFGETGKDRSIRAVILAANGKAFSAGHDLSEMTNRTVSDYREIFTVCTELMEAIQAISQPVIAQVQGVATAAGCQLAATCDLAVASEEAVFATPGVRIGLFCTTPMVALTRAIGRKRAMEMLLTGNPISAETAAAWGLINRVAKSGELANETRALASQIASASGLTVSVGKSAYYSQIDLSQSQAYAYAREVMTMNALAEDAREGITAFLEKRAPCWSGQ